ncbi:hypothetical protein AB0K14_23045 [Actinosynnema sp. NPDC050801]|uniref:hypothetical protein n=1 Tax=unclassified Actinosynnema TaxID=2637065 RepID=UPI0033C9F391
MGTLKLARSSEFRRLFRGMRENVVTLIRTGQVEPGQPVGIGEDVKGDDLPVDRGEAHDREQGAVDGVDESGGSVVGGPRA